MPDKFSGKASMGTDFARVCIKSLLLLINAMSFPFTAGGQRIFIWIFVTVSSAIKGCDLVLKFNVRLATMENRIRLYDLYRPTMTSDWR